MKKEEIKSLFDEYVLPTYTRQNICLVKGKGSRVWDIDGKEYIDFFPGWAVSGLGHCHPMVVNAIKHQARKILHVSNNFMNVKQARLAEEISKAAFASRSFFCNSGAEAVEAAIKFARRYGFKKGRFEIIAMKNSFHGRTFGALTATGQSKYREGFAPLPEGFKYADFNSIESFKNLLTDKTVAVILEPVQGEGGINVADKEYILQLKEICDERDILLIFDEVQTCMGRTGKLFAYQHYGIEPDLMTLAKSLGGGVAIGALVVNNKVENVLVPGTHASTFGGNPLAAAAAIAVFKAIKKEQLLKNVERQGEYLRKRLEDIAERSSFLHSVRGLGLMLGIECAGSCTEIVSKSAENGLLINCTQGNVLRMACAINISGKVIDKGLEIFENTLKELSLCK